MEIEAFHLDALVIDIHVHSRDVLIRPFRLLNKMMFPKTMPPYLSLSAPVEGAVDAVVPCAVGDFKWGGYTGSILRQLNQIRKDMNGSGLVPVLSASDIMEAKRNGVCGALLGLEGGNVLAKGPDESDGGRLDILYRNGVRMITLVHLSDNALGTCSADAWSYWKKTRKPRRDRGLTALGEAAIRRMNEMGVIVDVAHGDGKTIAAAAAVSRRPVVASHSGAKGISDFHRYLDDARIRDIARTGGVIGLWPMFCRETGMRDLNDFCRHAEHIVRLVGDDHVAVGTDFNGVGGYMAGYNTPSDWISITRALFDLGWNETRVRKILGLNFLRVLKENTCRVQSLSNRSPVERCFV